MEPAEIKKPIGTVAEVEALGLSAKEFPTCSVPKSDVRGCDWAKKDPATGVTYCQCTGIMGKSGPRNFAVRIHNGHTKTAIVRQVDCMWIASEYSDIVNNKGAIKIIAAEGDDYTFSTGMVDPKTGRREDKDVTAKVPAYPRPQDNPVVQPFLEHTRALREMQERNNMTQEQRVFGIGGGLDAGFENPRGSGGGGGEEGRAGSKKG